MNEKELIASRAAALLQPGWVVNLGIGIPTLVTRFVDADTLCFQTENGLLGVGPPPERDRVDPNLVDAGKRPVTERLGASFFDSATSFAMIRGGHVDAVILGALQVDEKGRVANWAIPGEPVLGVGGAMDLMSGARNVIVVMTHTAKDGAPKLVRECTLPLTSLRPVTWVVTELATFGVGENGLSLVECAPGVSVDTVRAKTAARFQEAALRT
ncbi:MAG TPA: 3-oxoacid CoA-transferase subunit B [Candidatus Methylomirabilis sp.]|nr:3-oxoacid CoA-transferase subunit B [Candidatus Methylomirabilis sp.]